MLIYYNSGVSAYQYTIKEHAGYPSVVESGMWMTGALVECTALQDGILEKSQTTTYYAQK